MGPRPLAEAFPAPWRELLGASLDEAHLARLEDFLARESAAGEVFPPREQIFNALAQTPPSEVKVVLLGQDPYHGLGEAHGLCFSVPPGVRTPPSLRNLFKELEADLGIPPPDHGCLDAWAREGVLLLNAVLTVRQDRAGSHRGKGWEPLTDGILDAVNRLPRPVVFVLLGREAQKKAARVDARRHAVIQAPHPSPLSAHSGFFGSRIFSRVNEALRRSGQAPVDWRLPACPPAGVR